MYTGKREDIYVGGGRYKEVGDEIQAGRDRGDIFRWQERFKFKGGKM